MPSTPETWLDAFSVNASQVSPTQTRATQLTNGNVLVAWQDGGTSRPGDPAGDDVYGTILDPLGNVVRAPYRLNQAQFNDDEGDFSIAALSNGGYALVYVDDNGSTRDVWLEEHDSTGTRSATVRVARQEGGTDPTTPFDPRVVSSGDTALVVWNERHSNGLARDEVKFAVWDPATDTLGAARTAFRTDTDARDFLELDAAPLANGQYVVVASHGFDTSGNTIDSYLRFEIIDNDGTQSGTSQAVAGTRNDGDKDVDPSVAGLAGGGFVIAWTDIDTDNDVAFQRFSATGAPLGGIVAVNNVSSGSENGDANVLALADGGFVIVWEDESAGFRDADVRLQRFDANGSTVGNVVTLDTGIVLGIEAISLADGRLMVTWSDLDDTFVEIIDTRDDANATPVYAPDDWQVGTVGNDSFLARADIVRAYEGDDTVTRSGLAGRGQDVDGGAGTDTIDGAGANYRDTVTWNLDAGAYIVSASPFRQTWTNFENYDNASSVSGSESVVGTAGRNGISLGGGDNRVEGGAGNDNISGGGGADRLLGQVGDDTIFGNTGDDLLDGGSGDDILFGNDGRDELLGGANADSLLGGDDNDVLRGGTGDDELDGGDDADILFGGAGADLIDGGRGFDFASYTDATAAIVLDILAPRNNAGFAAGDVLVGIENLVGSNLGDTIRGGNVANTILGRGGNDVIEGRGGADTLRGEGGADQLDGGTGNDTLEGGIGNDVLRGGEGADRLDGGAGADILFGGEGGDVIVGGTGFDFVSYNDTTAGITLDLLGVRGNRGDARGDVIALVENIVGSGGADAIYGGNVANNIAGRGGNDTIVGRGGADVLSGEGGTDIVDGGAGADVLSGGAGGDFFNYTQVADSTAAIRDTITDFAGGGRSGGDVLDLASIDANARVGGNQGFTFVGTAAFSGAAGELRYSTAGGDATVQADVDGDRRADLVIDLDDVSGLVASDFLL